MGRVLGFTRRRVPRQTDALRVAGWEVLKSSANNSEHTLDRFVSHPIVGRMSTARKFWFCVIMLYAITWIGGFRLHSSALHKQAQHLYDETRKGEAKANADRKHLGQPPKQADILSGGPVVNVNWCVPVLPGVLIADSEYIIGRLQAAGGVRILIFYGWGLWEIDTIWVRVS